MRSKISIIILLTLIMTATSLTQAQTDFPARSAELLQAVKTQNQPTIDRLTQQLAEVSPQTLADDLSDDTRRKTFWINLYNSYVIILLRENPDLYDDRDAFFTEPRATIAQAKLSFDDIEHGILRRSKIKLSLGLANNPFAGDYEKMMRVDEVDWRIHFALNCGADACPPVEIYHTSSLDQQLENRARLYLKNNTVYREADNTVIVTPLMSWFRGDFGGSTGVKEILKSYSLIPQESDPSLEYKDYDWTLDIDNFASQ